MEETGQTQFVLAVHSESDTETPEVLSRKILPVSEITMVDLASWAPRLGQPIDPVPDTELTHEWPQRKYLFKHNCLKAPERYTK
jgi:hypothetical protein